jgi:hypothetical protein
MFKINAHTYIHTYLHTYIHTYIPMKVAALQNNNIIFVSELTFQNWRVRSTTESNFLVICIGSILIELEP